VVRSPGVRDVTADQQPDTDDSVNRPLNGLRGPHTAASTSLARQPDPRENAKRQRGATRPAATTMSRLVNMNSRFHLPGLTWLACAARRLFLVSRSRSSACNDLCRRRAVHLPIAPASRSRLARLDGRVLPIVLPGHSIGTRGAGFARFARGSARRVSRRCGRRPPS